MEKILAIIDTITDRIQPAGMELISFAGHISKLCGMDPVVMIAGRDIADAAETIAGLGLDVIAVEHKNLYYPNPGLVASAASLAMEQTGARVACLTHTMRGCQVAASIAVEKGGPCVTAVESVRIENGRFVFRKSMFNGKVTIELALPGNAAVLTILPGSFSAPDADAPRAGTGAVSRLPVGDLHAAATPVSIDSSGDDGARLEEAEVIVSAGRGIGVPANLELIRAVARLFHSAAIGASRTICDLKWIPYSHQIGVTGKTVAPRLYLACGISGAHQHIAGMKGSLIVVAVNRDPQAAIFSIADYSVVEDLTTFLPIFIEKYHELYG